MASSPASRPQFSIRPLGPDDAAIVAAVEIAVWQGCYRDILPEDYLASLSPAHQTAQWHSRLSDLHALGLAMASGDGRIAGFLAAGAPRDPPPGAARSYRGEIWSLNVLPEWQGRGYGRRLLAHANGWLAERGMQPPFIWVFSDSARTRGFIENIGGRPIAGRIVSIGGTRVARTAYGLPDMPLASRSGQRRIAGRR